ncbi:tyrosine-type recombinase/integrase [Desulfitobacterium sp.]|uniref:tyrosine-type recombinase/integrase n=1 Tax=Desulfitobacterium sp. TaxID=49981 RepID=UPI002B1FCD88|nr:tyrosine-type recombinase/integrase [Desulfitobacterium sp.]MEA4901433.1 tyrosine-type recombinase/integrase [Desulfitobacterium sp.]
MSRNYEEAVSRVMEYLASNNYTSSIVYKHKRCYRLLNEYLESMKLPYSPEQALEWLDSITPGLCHSTSEYYQLALSRINETLNYHEISNTKSAYEAVQYYQHLNPYYKELLDEFLAVLSKSHGLGSLHEHRVSASRFLDYLSKCGLKNISELNHSSIRDFYLNDLHKTQKIKDRYNGLIRHFLSHLANKGMVRVSIPLTLDKFVIQRLVLVHELPPSDRGIFYITAGSDFMGAQEFYSKTLILRNVYIKRHRYSKTMKETFRKAWKELFVFLEANGLNYCQETALSWANHMQHYTVQWRMFRRAVKIFEQFRNTGDIQPEIVYTYRGDKVENLPLWCRGEFRSFILHKSREGVAASTIQMYQASCLRFLGFLDRVRITAWDRITPEIIKDFHVSDPHTTPEARNAYAAKCRGFLEYLAEKGYIPSTLVLALSNESAARVDIIRTLDANDISAIYEFKNHAHTDIQLRNATMIMIGLRMGIRASDITKLKLSDISWKQRTISVQQAKTDKFLKLPMPTEVGNSLYRYIMDGRPETSSDYLFIMHRVPYGKLEKGVCARVLKKVLSKDPHGFHVTRKTFASRMLINNTNPTMIAETLGRSDNSTVMTYLSTDGKSMRQCAISLEGIEVKGGMLS